MFLNFRSGSLKKFPFPKRPSRSARFPDYTSISKRWSLMLTSHRQITVSGESPMHGMERPPQGSPRIRYKVRTCKTGLKLFNLNCLSKSHCPRCPLVGNVCQMGRGVVRPLRTQTFRNPRTSILPAFLTFCPKSLRSASSCRRHDLATMAIKMVVG